jgi:hypothetical protein
MKQATAPAFTEPVSLIAQVEILQRDTGATSDADAYPSEVASSQTAECDSWRKGGGDVGARMADLTAKMLIFPSKRHTRDGICNNSCWSNREKNRSGRDGGRGIEVCEALVLIDVESETEKAFNARFAGQAKSAEDAAVRTLQEHPTRRGG